MTGLFLTNYMYTKNKWVQIYHMFYVHTITQYRMFYVQVINITQYRMFYVQIMEFYKYSIRLLHIHHVIKMRSNK